MKNRSFTLIELLVVIAIIAILAAMLMPALSKAKENGAKATCQNNLKQLTLCIYRYQTDFNDRFIASVRKITGTVIYARMLRYGGYFQGMKHATYSYGSGEICPPEIMTCPSEKRVGRDTIKATRPVEGYGASYDYGMNTHTHPVLVNNKTQAMSQTKSIAKLRYPSKAMMVMDHTNYVAISTHTMRYRHAKALNAVMQDGHIERFGYGRVPTGSSAAETSLGSPFWACENAAIKKWWKK